jgi:hypothetical protein
MATTKARLNRRTGPYEMQKTAWSGAAADYNIAQNGPGGSVGGDYGECCRAIIVTGLASGSISTTDIHGNTVLYPFGAFTTNPKLEVQLASLNASGSTGCNVIVLW